MKVYFKRIALLAFFMVTVLILSSCGARISTVLTINDSLSGEKIISCAVSKSDAKDKFKGGVAKIDSIIATSCPQEMTYTKTEDTNDYIYKFVLPFSSLEDYKAKVEKIIGRTPNITLAKIDSVFANGITVNEDFDSRSLLVFFENEVKKENLVDDISNLWEISSTKVIFSGKEYSTDSNINVNDITYYPLDKIIINTTINDNGAYDRTIKFVIPNSTYDAKSEDINSFMEGLVPQGGTKEWTADEYNKIFILSFNATDSAELLSKTSVALNSNNNTFAEEKTLGDNPLSKYSSFNESLDFSSFASDYESRVNVEYVLTVPSNDIILNVNDGNYTNTIGSNTFSGNYRTQVLSLTAMKEQRYKVEAIDVKTNITSENTVKKSMVLTYSSEVPEEATVRAKEYFESLGAKALSVITSKNESGRKVCELVFEGDLSSVNGALRSVFNEGNEFSYTAVKKGLAKININFSESINIENFVNQIGYAGEIHYTVNGSKGEKIKQLTVQDVRNGNSSNYEKLGNIYSATISPVTRVNYDATKTSMLGALLFFLILILTLGAIVTGLFFLVRWLAKKDGMGDQNIKELFVHYGNIAWVNTKKYTIIARSGTKNFLSNIGDGFLPSNARVPVVRYFYGTKWPILLVLFTILRIPSFIGGFFNFILGAFQDHTRVKAGITILPEMFMFITLLAALIIYLKEKFRTNSLQEKSIDDYIQADLQDFKERALKKLGLIEEEVSMISPIKVIGPYYGLKDSYTKRSLIDQLFQFIKHLFIYRTKLVFKYGSDEKIRYSVIEAHIFLYSENQLYAYEASYDLCTGEIFEEATSEYFYKNVSCILSGERFEKVIAKKKIIDKKYEYFKVITSSGAFNYAVVDGAEGILCNQIIAMKNLVREKKDYKRKLDI